MNPTLQRIIRYLILWGILLLILIVISVIRHWDALVAVVSGTISGFFTSLLSLGLLVGLFIWGFRLMFRGFR